MVLNQGEIDDLIDLISEKKRVGEKFTAYFFKSDSGESYLRMPLFVLIRRPNETIAQGFIRSVSNISSPLLGDDLSASNRILLIVEVLRTQGLAILSVGPEHLPHEQPVVVAQYLGHGVFSGMLPVLKFLGLKFCVSSKK